MRTHLAIAAAASLLLAACGSMNLGGGSESGVTQEELVSAQATVQAVDRSTRAVTLRDSQTGDTFTVFAGDEVRNFDQIDVGDVVQMDYYQAVTLEMADPADPGEEMTGVVTARAPEGARPAGLAATTTSVVVTFQRYDPNNRVAYYLMPDGLERRAVVPPEMVSFVENRAPGSRILVTLTEAVAVSIVEVAA
jgi:hypothetical protein